MKQRFDQNFYGTANLFDQVWVGFVIDICNCSPQAQKELYNVSGVSDDGKEETSALDRENSLKRELDAAVASSVNSPSSNDFDPVIINKVDVETASAARKADNYHL